MNLETIPVVLYPRREVESTVNRLAAEINRDYTGRELLVIGILKGSFMFMADLVRNLEIPVEIDFGRLRSYGSGHESTGKIEMLTEIQSKVRNRNVLLVEDIVDTGFSVEFMLEYLQRKGPDSLKVCALLDKPSRRRVPVAIDYRGLSVPDKFLVGYGLDYDEKYRNLPDICFLENRG